MPSTKSASGVPDPIDIEIGARIRAARAAAGWSQTRLAETLGLSFQQVQNMSAVPTVSPHRCS